LESGPDDGVLLHARTLVRAMFSEGAQPLVITRLADGVVVEASPGFCELSGWPRDELVGRSSGDLGVWPTPRHELLELLQHGRGAAGIETSLRRRGGEIRYCRLSVQRVELDGVDHLLAIVVDVTARVIAERALAEVEERFRLLVEEMPAITFMDALDGTPLYTSPQVRTMLGYDPDEWSARWPAQVHPDDRDRVQHAYSEHLSTLVPYVEEYRMFAADGHARWWHDQSVIVRDGDGTPRFSLGFLLDVTERRRAQDALRVSEHARRDVLAAMLRAEEQTLARIATELHDDTIQAITAALLSMDRARTAAGGGAPVLDAARRSLSDALDRTRRMTFELRPPVLETHGLHPSITDLARGTADEAEFDLDLDLRVGRYSFAAEELAYRTVQEALANVRKHARARHVLVRLRERAGALEGEITDDGAGFDLARALDRRAYGRHMGLDSMLARVRLAGGRIDVSSSPGEGTRVTFAIPAAMEDTRMSETSEPRTSGDSAPERPGEDGEGEEIWTEAPGQDGPPEGEGS
jgi:two-component system, NarL family, sensor histidine kinase UhpB